MRWQRSKSGSRKVQTLTVPVPRRSSRRTSPPAISRLRRPAWRCSKPAAKKPLASPHEQLTKERADLAAVNWRLGMPGTPPSKFESANFLVLGSVGENTLADIAKRAEALAPKVAEIFKAPRDQPLVKGRVTLFVFGERYNYGEFGKMVEERDLPTSWRGHYRFSIVDAYGVVLSPKAGDYSLDALIAQQLAAVYIASLGKGVPHWLAEG